MGLVGTGRHGRKAKIVERIAVAARVAKDVRIGDPAVADRKDATKAGPVVAAVDLLKDSPKSNWRS